MNRFFSICLVVDGEAGRQTKIVTVGAKYFVGKRMKRAAIHATASRVPFRCPRYHLSSASPREGQEQDGWRTDAGLDEVVNAELNDSGFAASGTGYDEHGAVDRRDRLVLPVIEQISDLFLHSSEPSSI